MKKKESSPYWLTTSDIQTLMCCGRTLAWKYMRECNRDLEKNGKFVPRRGLTSRSWFFKMYGLEGKQ